jgi:hypothetical protein
MVSLLLGFGGMGFSAPLTLTRIVNLLQHVCLRRLQTLGRRVELGAKGGIAGGDPLLKVGCLPFLLRRTDSICRAESSCTAVSSCWSACA